MAAIQLRNCCAEDIEAIASIYCREVEQGVASFETEPPSIEELHKRWQALVQAGYPYLVAEIEGQIAGYSYAGPYRSRPAYSATVENSVYVHQRYKRQGVARALLEALIEECSARGFRQMIAVIGDSENWPSIKLHAQMGFDEIGTLRSVGWKHGRWLDSVLMQRPLGDGDTSPSLSPSQEGCATGK